jgi:hypothetical protein
LARVSAASADGGSDEFELTLMSRDCERSHVETVSNVSDELVGSDCSKEVMNVSQISVGGSDVSTRNACISSLIAFPIAVSLRLSVENVAMCSSINEPSLNFHFIMPCPRPFPAGAFLGFGFSK